MGGEEISKNLNFEKYVQYLLNRKRITLANHLYSRNIRIFYNTDIFLNDSRISNKILNINFEKHQNIKYGKFDFKKTFKFCKHYV